MGQVQNKVEKEKRSGYPRGHESGFSVWLGHSFSQNPVSIFARFPFFFLGTITSLSKFTDHPLLQYTLKSDLIYDNHFPDVYVNCDGIVDAYNIFDEMGEQGAAMMSCYVHHDWPKKELEFYRMR